MKDRLVLSEGQADADPLALDAPTRARLWTRLAALVEKALAREASARPSPPPNRQKIEALLRRLDPARPADPLEALEEVARALERGQVHPGHPRYFGLFNPAPAALSVAADALVAAFNPQLATYSHSPLAVALERRLVRWFGEAFGYAGAEADGAFTSGGAEAALTALVLALTDRFPNHATEGLIGLEPRPMVYAGAAAHPTVERAARVCGLGSASVRIVGDPAVEGPLDPGELALAIGADRARGALPLMVVATLGSTATGAVDPISAVGEVARAEGLWLHVDAAWGGLAALVPRLAHLARGSARADSIAFDPHKALSVPMGAGMLLTRRGALLDRAFAAEAGYMPRAGREPDPFARSLAWSRRFCGLKLYLPLVAAGWDGYRASLERQVALGERLRAGLAARGWTLVAPTELPLVCFTWAFASATELSRIAGAVVASGAAWLSVARAGALPVLRACVVNHRTRASDVDALLDALDRARTPLSV